MYFKKSLFTLRHAQSERDMVIDIKKAGTKRHTIPLYCVNHSTSGEDVFESPSPVCEYDELDISHYYAERGTLNL